MYKINIDKEILNRHKKYMLDSDIKSSLESFRDNTEYRIYGKEHIDFCNFMIGEIENLNNNDILLKDNIFLSKPNVLNNYIKKVKSEYKTIFDLFNSKGLKYGENFLEKMGYEKFSSIEMKEYYNRENQFFKDLSISNIKKQLIDIKTTQRITRYTMDSFMLHIEYLVEKIDELIAISVGDNYILDIFEQLKNELLIFKSKINSIENKDNYIKQVKKIISAYDIRSLENKISEKSINIFNYEKYKKKTHNIQWSAYDFVMSLGLKVCPYCNRQFITPIYSENGKMRGDLDHFFSKDNSPFLSMSIYNLVPACKFCNSSLKGTKKFSYDKYLNPFEYSVDEYIKFNYIINSYEALQGDGEIEIVLEENLKEDKNLIEKAHNNIKAFDIINSYQYHINVIKDLIKKRIIYNDSYIENLWESNKNIFKDRDEVVCFITNSISYEKNGDFPLSKLANDIIKDLEF